MNTFNLFGNIITIYIIILQLGLIGDPLFVEFKKKSLKNFLCWFALLTQINSIHFGLLLPIWQNIFK